MRNGVGGAWRVLVTGVAGMVGFHVAELLLAKGHEVVGVDNFVTGLRQNVDDLADSPRFCFHSGDVSTTELPDGPFDAVLHLASPASPRHFRTMPVAILRAGSIGTLRLLELAERCGARFVLASSSEIYGDPVVHPQHEDYPGNVALSGERACYDEAKRFAEAAADTYRRIAGVDARVARIFNTYGPRVRADDGRVVPNFVLQALTGRPLTVYGDGTQTRSYCYVADLARGVVALLEAPEAEVVNLGNPEEHTVLYLARRVLELTGSSSPIEHRPMPENDPTRRRPDITRAVELLDWRPVTPLDEGLARTIDYFRGQLG